MHALHAVAVEYMQRALLQIASLPPEERRQMLQLVDAFIERGQLKRKAQSKQAA
jgi:hypothetical protein